jgi:3'(2'), 5'-bisphosphate nucleotidase
MTENLLETAIKAAIGAGDKILSIYDKAQFEIEQKTDNSPLTEADMAAHDFICKVLEETAIPILSEEGASIDYSIRKKYIQLWIVDPLDGTKEFIKRNGEFTVNIALVQNGLPILGVIFVPVSATIYFSLENLGSYKANNVSSFSSLTDLLQVSEKLPIANAPNAFTIVASRSHLSDATGEFINEMRKKHGDVKLVSMGSSLKLCLVAEGSANCYPRFAPTMEWDTAAGQAICKMAGFKVIDYETKKEMVYNRENLLNNWFLVE